MNSPEESALTDLTKFVGSVLNGMVDLESTAYHLIQYMFSVRTIKDVVRRASEDPELISQVFDNIHHLVIYLNEEIVETSGKSSPRGMDTRHFVELHKRLQLLYEVWKAMNVNEAYTVPELMDHITASKEAIKHCYENCSDYHGWTQLSPDLREFFLDEKEEETSINEVVEPTLFAREDGVVSSLAHEKAQSGDEGKKKQFVAKTEKVLSNYRAKNPDYKTMRELIKAKTNFRLEGTYCDLLINEFILIWDIAIDYEAEKSEEKYTFTALLRKVFMLMIDKRRNDFAGKLLDKYRKDANDVLPCLENFVDNFQNGLTEAVNQLPLDSNILSNNMELFDKTKDPIIWFLFISPAHTVQQLLTICVDNKGYIPIIGRIFRLLPTLFERSVYVTPLPHEELRKEKLLITMLHRTFTIGRTTWESASQWDNAAMMTMSYAKERKRKEGQSERMEDKALLDPYSVINFALVELMEESRKPQKAVETFVKMLQRLLANNNNIRMFTNYRFGNSYTDEGENVLPTPIIIQLMFDLLVEYDGQSNEICDSARETLKSIGGRMTSDEIIFDNDTCQYFTHESFNAAPWWIKYSIYSWFSAPLQNPKKQVPSGIYKTLEQSLDGFEQIKSEEVSTVSDCYLRSIFELGLFDADLAIDLLKYSYGFTFDGSVVERMALALVDTFGKKMSKKAGGLDISKLIMELLKKFDLIRSLTLLDTYCTSYLDSLKKVEHILILFMATRVAREKQLSASRIGTDETKLTSYDELLTLKGVAEQLMDVFCETAKAHVEKEANEIEQLRREANALIFSPGRTREQINAMVLKDEREQSLTLQMTFIYNKCTHFCRMYQDVPTKLKQLMTSTFEKQYESQKNMAKRVMDNILTDQRKTEVVYAFVEKKEEKETEKEAVQPVKPSELFGPKPQKTQMPAHSRTSTAETTNFNRNSEDHRQRKGTNQAHDGNGSNSSHENYRPSSIRVSGVRNERTYSYRGPRNQPVNDTHVFQPRERDAIYKNVKHPPYSDYDRSTSFRNETPKYPHEENLYFNDRRTPHKPQNLRQSDDVRTLSESKNCNFESSWDRGSRRWTSESENIYDDSENRLFDQTVRSVQMFANREQSQVSSQAGPSTSPPKIQEGKQQKKGFGEHSRLYGNTRKQDDRKHRERPSSYNEQEEEEITDRRLKAGQPDREELANALGFNNRPSNPQKSRRGQFHNH